MKLGLLRQTNPAYDAETWVRYEALYRGGKDFKANAGKFLLQNRGEPPDVYQARLREASYRSYVGPIVDYFASQLMAAPMTIRCTDRATNDELEETDEFYSSFKEDVDGQGTDLIDLARNAFRTALVKGACWFVAALPSKDGVEPVNQAEYQERGLGDAKAGKLEPENVLDWECDESGSLLWVMTYEESRPRASVAASRAKIHGVWRIFDTKNVTVYERDWEERDGPGEDDVLMYPVSEEPHGFNRVPLIRVELPRGLWLMNRVADAQVEHFRLSAGLGWAIRRTCYAMPVFRMGSSVGPEPVMGSGYFLKVGEKDSVDWVAPPAQAFTVISDEMKAQKDEIYRVAQQMAQGVDNSAASVGRSADSKRADASSTEVCLVAYGAVVREALEKLYDLVAEGRGDAIKFHVGGLDKFNLADPTVAVDNAVSASGLDVPSETFNKELLMHTADALLPGLAQETKDAIRKEIEAGIKEQMAEKKAAKEAAAKALAAGPAGQPQQGESGKKPSSKPVAKPEEEDE